MSTAAYTEQDFEDHVCERLQASGYALLPAGAYDRALALIPAEVAAFLQATQPKAYEALQKQYGADTDRTVTRRIAQQLDRYGALHVLRGGVRDRGQHLRLTYFKPASALNPAHHALYAQNRLGVVRQLRYSRQGEQSLDLVLFLNGIPVLTAELKNTLTGQRVEHAQAQYRDDRNPREPLFRFKRCVAHFAVGNEEVYYTTCLAGDDTFFLPFNQGTADGGAGNPVNPHGHKTAYLWEAVWQPDSLLDLLQNYLHVQEVSERVYDPERREVVERTEERLIFPRYHQLDAVRSLLAAARAEGAGHNYLIQHSAGSGKSNSIAWLAHQLAGLYRSGDGGGDGAARERLFDSIVIVTDRRVLDRQLQRTVKQFERVTGVVMPIDATSAQLKAALEKGKDIVITTLQKFPVISDAVADLGGRRFAVIIDEAHSSQSGESAKHLKKALAVDPEGDPEDDLERAEEADAEDAAEDLEDRIVEEIRTRGQQRHLSYFAFTATPKPKTLELFGRKDASGRPVPFHTYTMRQAIEERFILDVLQNYATFKRYFKLVQAVPGDDEYERSKAVRALTSWVDLQDHAIDTKAEIILDHFQAKTARAIGGKGRAMVVTRSRLHAIRFYFALRRLMREWRLPYAPLVAFSGTVEDPKTGASHTENGLNGLPPRVGIPDALKLPSYRLLVVANKYQTGFDEPLLHTMYVDKKLGGVQAVQTLSRLNRTAWSKGKTETAVLDFVNEAEAIQEAFQDYYQITALEGETDPNKLYDLQTRLALFDVYTREDVDAYAAVFFDDRQPDEALQPILDRVVEAWREREADEREAFRSALQAYVRLYGYVSQLITFEDVDLEKLYAFARSLGLKLPKRTDAGLPVGVTDAVDLGSFRVQQTYEGAIELEAKDATVYGTSAEGGRQVREPDTDYLSNIIHDLNETHGLVFEGDQEHHFRRYVENVTTDEEVLAAMHGNNSASNKRLKVDAVAERYKKGIVDDSIGLFQKLMDPRVDAMVKRRLFATLVEQTTAGDAPSAAPPTT